MKFVRKVRKPNLRGPLRHLLIQGSPVFEPAVEPEDVSVTMDAVPGLQDAIDAKASTVHTHAISAVTGLQTSLDAKAAATTLTSLASDVSALDTRLATVENASPGDGPSAESFPVGMIVILGVATDANALIGYGTWVVVGAGRVLVGLDAGQAEFDTLLETGGAKTHTLVEAEIPSHTHVQNPHTHNFLPRSATTGAVSSIVTGTLDTSSTISGANQPHVQAATAVNLPTGGGGAHNNLQPYLVVKFWQRTA